MFIFPRSTTPCLYISVILNSYKNSFWIQLFPLLNFHPYLIPKNRNSVQVTRYYHLRIENLSLKKKKEKKQNTSTLTLSTTLSLHTRANCSSTLVNRTNDLSDEQRVNPRQFSPRRNIVRKKKESPVRPVDTSENRESGRIPEKKAVLP